MQNIQQAQLSLRKAIFCSEPTLRREAMNLLRIMMEKMALAEELLSSFFVLGTKCVYNKANEILEKYSKTEIEQLVHVSQTPRFNSVPETPKFNAQHGGLREDNSRSQMIILNFKQQQETLYELMDIV
jgi:hypothetical protein